RGGRFIQRIGIRGDKASRPDHGSVIAVVPDPRFNQLNRLAAGLILRRFFPGPPSHGRAGLAEPPAVPAGAVSRPPGTGPLRGRPVAVAAIGLTAAAVLIAAPLAGWPRLVRLPAVLAPALVLTLLVAGRGRWRELFRA